MPIDLTPDERTTRARMAAHAMHSKYDSRAITTNARKAGPGNPEYFFDQVDPDRTLDPVERLRRAEHAKKAHFHGLALKSAKARRAKAAAR
jgi:hypothetical protein